MAGGLTISGSLSLLVALGSFLACWDFVHTAERAAGHVTQVVESGQGRGLYAPVFAFHDSRGVQHVVHSNLFSDPPEHRIGDAVGVLYSEKDPEHAKPDTFFSIWGLPVTAGFIGVTHLTVGLLMWHWPRFVRNFNREPVPIGS
jgi:hypothetical protein